MISGENSLRVPKFLNNYLQMYSPLKVSYNNYGIHLPLPFRSQLPVNKLMDQLRTGVAQAGFTEALTFALVGPGIAAHVC